ncbi:hypothetical protein IL306_009144 [Fusarium sp. DS 682]|nr:hypothetical protein IL306_009144 [Fusarium sp. DS 682]
MSINEMARGTNELWNLFDARDEGVLSPLTTVKCPKPDQAFFLPIYHRNKDIGNPKVVDPEARQWHQFSDLSMMEPFTWSTFRELHRFGLQPTPFRIFEKPPLEANLRCYPWLVVEHKREKSEREGLEQVVNCQAANAAACAVNLIRHTAQYAAELPEHAHIPPIPVITTVDEVTTKRRQQGYVMRAIWKGDITQLKDVLKLKMLLDNAHTWATRVFKPLISSYIQQWNGSSSFP